MIAQTDVVGDTYGYVVAAPMTYGATSRLGHYVVTADAGWKSFAEAVLRCGAERPTSSNQGCRAIAVRLFFEGSVSTEPGRTAPWCNWQHV